ncbi:transmembrane protein 183A [Periophthalmus magnuspinnatus]|uniref:transmembrane protein 183A n=1 Tax=Periophthalmus magnuspinnatus TaxID=409849 RepID=UPI00145A2930|nr:transmembrane protein 183A [Periophthalmus magnuspinnatus]
MPKKGNRKRLKFRAGDVCSESVSVADYADADPAVVKSGRVKKAVVNAVEKEVKFLCGLEASQGTVDEVLTSAVCVNGDALESGEEPDLDEENQSKAAHKKKNKRRKENGESGDGQEYPVDIWLVLSSYIRPEDVCRFALICRNAWIVTCTAAFWSRLYKRHYNVDADLPLRLQPDSVEKMRCLRARVIRSLFHLYEPFTLRVSQVPSLPETTPSTLLNSKCLLFWVQKLSGTRPEPLWEFNFKFVKQGHYKNGRAKVLCLPQQYEDVHRNPDSDCYMLQVTTLNFIFIPVVMGMTLTLFTLNVSTDMRHHRVRLVFQDSPLPRGKKRAEQGDTQVVLDPVHSVRLMDWWHPQYPFSSHG